MMSARCRYRAATDDSTRIPDLGVNMIKVLRQVSSGNSVLRWQAFLRGQAIPLNVTGHFEDATVQATQQFQSKHRLIADGIVGSQTLGQAALLGFEIVDHLDFETEYPIKPNFPALPNSNARQQLFGPLEFAPAPTAKNPERIRITNNWVKNNVVELHLPLLANIPGANGAIVHFHRKAANQLVLLWHEWQAAGLLDRILSYDGDFVPRFIRGRADDQMLSNHAFATAFDINYAWNKLGVAPAPLGSRGCVYELVSIANAHGFYWGGHFNRKDGMHFEVAKIIK